MRALFRTLFIFIAAFAVTAFTAPTIFAATGTIDGTYKYSQFLNIDLDNDATDDFINWLPTNAGQVVSVTDTAITGDIWGESVGWISLDPTNGGVTNNCSGELGGYAWGQNTGWINFGATNATIDPNINTTTGEITGQVWSQNYGWIELASPDGTYPGLKTTWLGCGEEEEEEEDPPTGSDASLRIIKNVDNTNGGQQAPENFTIRVSHNGSIIITGTGSPTGRTYDDDDGINDGETYVISEVPTAGYTTVFSGPDCDANGVVIFPDNYAGQLTCRITNYFGAPPQTASIRIIKRVVNSASPAGNFNVFLRNIISRAQVSFAGSESGEVLPITPGGSYLVGETWAPGYTATFSGDSGCSNSRSFTVPVGFSGQMTCVVTNTYTGIFTTTDVCLNIDGNQSSVPNGYYQIVTTSPDIGNCFLPNTDVCPNLDGEQSVVPNGYYWDAATSQCLPDNDPIDYCPNIAGNQSSVPNNLVVDQWGNCVPDDTSGTDVCLNIDGDQSNVPNGYARDLFGNCVLGDTDYCPNIPGNQSSPTDCPGPTDYCPDIADIQSSQAECPPVVTDPPILVSVIESFVGEIPPWLLPIIAVIGFLGSIPGLITRFGNLILTFVFARKKPRGIVYDAVTKEPLDPAYVRLFDSVTGTEIGNQFTDLEGRYGFVLKQGTYHMTADKTHYVFPSKLLAGKTSDEVYDNLYFGESFAVGERENVTTMNIPMDPIAADWNQVEKRRMNPLRFLIRNQTTFGWLFNILFAVGFAASIVITWYYPVWWNIVMTSLYVVIAAIQAYGLGPVTIGTITKNDAPLGFAIIRVYNAALGREIARKVTTELGGYYILVPKADYYITVEEKQADGTYVKIYESNIVRAYQGLINKSFNIT